MTASGNLSLGGVTVLNGNTVFIGGGLSLTTTGLTSGTTLIILNGTGTWNHSAVGQLRNNLTINTSGTITITINIYYNTGTLTYTAGTVVTTGSNLNIGASTTLTTNGMIWNNILTGGVTLTLTNLLSATGTLSLSTGTTFVTSGFTVGTLSLTSAGATHQIVSTQTHTINTSLLCTAATNASRVLLRSTTPGSKALLNLSPAATQDLGFVNATDINSLGGKKIYSYKATLSNTDNWATLPTDPIFETSSTFFG